MAATRLFRVIEKLKSNSQERSVWTWAFRFLINSLRCGGADAAGFEAVGLGFGYGGEADAVLQRDAVDPVAVL